MQHRGKKPDSFAVARTKSGRNIIIEVRDARECVRPSVEKDIHSAVHRLLRRMCVEVTEEGTQNAVHE
jgi:hypothetical protein